MFPCTCVLSWLHVKRDLLRWNIGEGIYNISVASFFEFGGCGRFSFWGHHLWKDTSWNYFCDSNGCWGCKWVVLLAWPRLCRLSLLFLPRCCIACLLAYVPCFNPWISNIDFLAPFCLLSWTHKLHQQTHIHIYVYKTHTHTHIYMYVCIYAFIMYVYILYLCVYVQLYISLCVCVYLYVYISGNSFSLKDSVGLKFTLLKKTIWNVHRIHWVSGRGSVE